MWHDIEQNTDEWLDLRAGKITGSSIGKIMANYGKSFGGPAKKLAVSIAREQATGKRSLIEQYSNKHMERGHEQEPIARRIYEDQYFTEVTNGGFFDCGYTGCSPDGLILNEGVIEIKSVVDHIHYANIVRGSFDPTYKWQLAFNLKNSNREWIDFVSFCADFPEKTKLYVHRTYKGEFNDLFEMMNKRIDEFLKLINEAKLIIEG